MANQQHQKSVSAVIPTYNGLGLLQQNLPAVFTCLRDGDEVVIVDDASTDQTVRWLNDAFNTRSRKIDHDGRKIDGRVGAFVQAKKRIVISVIPLKKNVRFAKAANTGVMVANHPLVFLLNSDVSPHSTVLRFLLPHFEDNSVFAVSCLELGTDEQGKPTQQGKNVISFIRGMFIHARADNLEAGPTAFATGGSSLFDRHKWLELGGFDPDYAPAYWEDVDLSFRASKKGWRVLFEPQAKVDHNHQTTNQDVFGERKIYQMSWQNANRFVSKNASWWQKILYYLWRPYWWLKVR
jgi:GT2 family glycosyltransferase